MTEEIVVQEPEKLEQQPTPSTMEQEVKQAKVLIGIPAYNAERLLERTVRPLWGLTDGILVCDDGSTDLTSQSAKYLGCKVIPHLRNLGYPASIRSLFMAAIKESADVLVIVDAGISCRRLDIENLARPIVFEDWDVVIGADDADNKADGMLPAPNSNWKINDSRQQEHFPVKAYSKKAMLELLKYDKNELRNLREAGRKSLGLKITKCLVSYHNFAIGEPAKITIQIPKRTNMVEKIFAPAKNFGTSVQTKIPKVLAKISAPVKIFASAVPSIFVTKIPKALENTWALQRKLLRNIWFLRSLCMISGMITASLLLAYSLIFLNTYFSFGNTTSYFPWSWHIDYIVWGTIEYQFLSAIGISLATISVCGFALWFLFIPRVRIS